MDNTALVASSSQGNHTTTSQLLVKMRQGFTAKDEGLRTEDEVISSLADQPGRISISEQLELLDQIISEVEAKKQASQVNSSSSILSPQSSGVVAQAMPQAMDQAVQTQTAQVASVRSGVKESAQGLQVFESIPGAQVEYENSAEIAPEVAEFVKEVEAHDQLPQEIAISGDSISLSQPVKTARKAVVVLPITPEIEAVGIKKSPKHSVRWLVEFAQKIMKMFTGEVVYREVNNSN